MQWSAKGNAKPDGIDLVKSKTRFSARHRSESKTRSWEKTEQTSHTRSTSRSVTDGTSVGDEITYDLTYEHRVQPETLMNLPEDQMLAPHIAESANPLAAAAAAGAATAVGAGVAAAGGAAATTIGTGAGGSGAVGAGGMGAAAAGAAVGAGTAVPGTLGVSPAPARMVALVVNPAVIGSDLVAPVSPEEIPSYQAPPPRVTPHVPPALENLRRP